MCNADKGDIIDLEILVISFTIIYPPRHDHHTLWRYDHHTLKGVWSYADSVGKTRWGCGDHLRPPNGEMTRCQSLIDIYWWDSDEHTIDLYLTQWGNVSSYWHQHHWLVIYVLIDNLILDFMFIFSAFVDRKLWILGDNHSTCFFYGERHVNMRPLSTCSMIFVKIHSLNFRFFIYLWKSHFF